MVTGNPSPTSLSEETGTRTLDKISILDPRDSLADIKHQDLLPETSTEDRSRSPIRRPRCDEHPLPGHRDAGSSSSPSRTPRSASDAKTDSWPEDPGCAETLTPRVRENDSAKIDSMAQNRQ